MGVGRAIIGFPIEHPFDLIKVRHQAQMNLQGSQLNEVSLVKEVWKTEGITGFYSGFMANTFRAAIKSSYRYPMMMFFPNFYGAFIQDKYQNKLISGFTIATLECLIISPL